MARPEQTTNPTARKILAARRRAGRAFRSLGDAAFMTPPQAVTMGLHAQGHLRDAIEDLEQAAKDMRALLPGGH